MRFTFSEQQLAFRDTVRDLLAKECPREHVRAMWSDETGRSPGLWRALADVGVVGLTVPVAHGGLGLDEVDLVLLLEETGRAALAAPIVETTAVAVPLLVELGATGWLDRVAAGAAIVTVGLEPAPFVADAHVADLLLLQRGDELHAVDAAHVGLEPRPTLDRSRRLFRVSWEPRPDTCLASGDAARPVLAAAFDRATQATAAQLLGVAAQLVDLTAAYAREREQFGQPIGAFQAVKHHLANALLALELARPVVYRAAFSVATVSPTRARDVSMAKAYASDAATLAARVALQVHGAIGYTWEHDLHIWMKRAWALAAAWGDAGWHRARVGDEVLGPRR